MFLKIEYDGLSQNVLLLSHGRIVKRFVLANR
jgi:hypothetical protein